MSYLLDTHAFLWFITDAPALSPTAKALIEDAENDICLSIASVWEMAIKFSLGKLKMPTPFAEFVETQLRENDIRLLAITTQHIEGVATLPFHHRDPFDRLMIAQAQREGFIIIGQATLFDPYVVERRW
jgi:PIN domain nuclease of toxin-antitoxin system